jgi:hypothetical protein
MEDFGNEMERICRWIYLQLQEHRNVTKEDFLKKFGKDPNGKDLHKDKQKTLLTHWNRAFHAVHAILSLQGAGVRKNRSSLALPERAGADEDRQSAVSRYTTERFQPNRESTAKEHIAGLIAPFLENTLLRGKTIFLGSGSTIFHVGLKMCGRRYDQRFVTVNIPLAAAWCEYPNPPVNKISIPEAVLETQTFRFSTMPGPGWPLTISIVGADGCFYDEAKNEVTLYGNEESVATNTSLFVQNTRHSVLFCLTSAKIKRGFAQNPNTGPPISPPKKGVIRVLVTDERYQECVKVFEKDDWMIVTEESDWDPVLKRMREGEMTEIRPE